MKYRISFYYLLILTFAGLTAFGQTATLTHEFSNESDVRSSSNTITITVDGDTLFSEIATDNSAAENFLAGFSSGSTVFNTMVDALDETNISLSDDDSVVVITFPADLDFYIASDEVFSFIIPAISLKTSSSAIAVTPGITITNSASTVTGDGGDLGTGGQESDIRTTNNTYDLVLEGNRWDPNISSSAAMLTAVRGMFSGGTAFPSMVSTLLSSDLSVSSDGKTLTILFQQNTNYFIPADETINVTVDQSLLEFPETLTNAAEDFQITNENPSISIVTETYTESSIRSGSTNFDITLSGDQWENPLNASFRDGIVSGGNWDTQITPNLIISRTSATVVTVTIQQTPGFDISSAEYVDATVLAIDLQFTNAGSYTSAEKKTVLPELASVSGSATFNGSGEGDIRSGSYELSLTISEDSWAAEVGTDDNINRDLINGILFSASQSTAATAMADAILGSDRGASNTSVVGNTVTFTIPAIPGFNITSDVDVSLVVPADAMNFTTSTLTASPFASIIRIEPSIVIETVPASPINSSVLNNAILNVKLYEETWQDNSFDKDNFDFTWNPANPATLNISDDNDISYISDNEINIELNFINSITEDLHFTMNVLSSELSGSASLTSALPGVSVIAIIDPVVTGVSIPNQGMGIGETVSAMLTVNDDKGQAFTLLGGSIGGRTIYDFQRMNATTYSAKFDVGAEGSNPQFAAGEDIPYTNIQLQNGAFTGQQYGGVISQSADPLDADRPLISLVSINGGLYKIGSSLLVTIQSPEANLLFDQNLTTINTIQLSDPSIIVTEVGSGLYQLTYTVQELHPDVVSPNPLPINVILFDGVGNSSLAATNYTGSNPVIDAHYPLITSVAETTNGPVIPGHNIVHTISAEDGLVLGDGTIINNVGITSGRISLTSSGAGTYQLIYEVGSNDNEVTPGNLNLTIILSDAAGNETEFSGVISDKDLSIVTSIPEVDIFGGGEICIGDSAELIINVTGGTAPYDVTLYENGVFYDQYVTDGDHLIVKVSPDINRNYLVFKIDDALGNSEHTSENVDVVVNSLPSVQFSSSTRKVFSFEGGGSYLLPATPVGGIFSGPGVVPSEGKFYPGIAGVTDSLGHNIVYTYQESATGCTATDTVNFTVLPTSGGLTVTYPDVDRKGIICYNDPSFEISGENVDGFIGSFNLYRIDKADTVSVPEAIIDSDPDDNKAIIDPSMLISRSSKYIVEYVYSWNGEIIIVDEQLEFDFIREISFSSTIPASVCKNEDVIDLEAVPNASGIFGFNGPGVLGNEILGFYYEPDSGIIGSNLIIYDYTSSAGCVRTAPLTIINYDVPDVRVTPQAVCIPPVDNETGEGGGLIGFNNETSKAGLVSKWMWEFGDINSGPDNFDTIPGNGLANDIIHNYTAPGTRSVSLKIETLQGCDVDFDTIIEFADKPEADWRAVSDCWISGESIELINLSSSEKAWDSFTWNIHNESMTWDTTIITNHIDSLARVLFSNSTELYEVQLIVANVAGVDLYCYDTLTDETFEIKRTQNFNDVDSRLMTFDNSNEKWTIDSASNYSSWVLGQPDFMGYEASGGDNAWFTRKDTAIAENSWIQSQCFDFRGLERPMIRMDIMKSFDQTRDGGVLQYSLDNGSNWITVGNIGEGINWYNSFEIINKPGGGKDGDGSSIGWSGEDSFNPDTNWVVVAHDLDELKEERLVIFGIFYATDGASVVENQGFAVDNIYIGERSKRALIEHFTNAGDMASTDADNEINTFISNNQLDVTSLQYHMHYPGDDPMNENNPAPASARSFYYGINQVPYALMDGGILPDYLYDFSPSKPSADQLRKLTLENPLFDLELKYQVHQYINRLSAIIDIAAQKDIDSVEIILNIAVVEKSVTENIGGVEKEFSNVVLDMLPSAGGFVFSKGWEIGNKYKEVFHWEYTNDIDIEDIMLIAFMQEKETGKILQVAVADSPIFPVSIISRKLSRMSVYPNPVRTVLYIENAMPAKGNGSVNITDMTGRTIIMKSVIPGEQHIEINTQDLSDGNYIINWKENGIITGRERFVKVR